MKKIELFNIDKTFQLDGQTVMSELKCFIKGCNRQAVAGIAITDTDDPLYHENICLCRSCAYGLHHRLKGAGYCDYELSNELERGK